jgi:hypothetical protein
MLISMACGSCVLSDPPVHGQATQTPPILYANQADPSPYVVIETGAGAEIRVNVPIRSEDDGEPLQAELILNHSIAGGDPYVNRLLGSVPVTAGSLVDDSRSVDIAKDLPPGLTQGCHQLTLLVTHASNLVPREKSDIATVTWWLNVDDDPLTANQLAECPKNTGSTN